MAAEKILHYFFKEWRVQPDKEFFKLSIGLAIKGANKALQSNFGIENLSKYQRLRDEDVAIDKKKILEAINALKAAKKFTEEEGAIIALNKQIGWLKQILD